MGWEDDKWLFKHWFEIIPMGTDIHLKVEQKKADGQWHIIDPPDDYTARDPYLIEQYAKSKAFPTPADTDSLGMDSYYAEKYHTCWYDMRNYDLFAILANVRNGCGFAGVVTGDGFNPISIPKGLPKDISIKSAQAQGVFGEHSFSWLTVKEMLDYDWKQKARKCGVIPLEEFKKFIETGIPPDSYCGCVAGKDCITFEQDEALAKISDNTIPTNLSVYVRVWWETEYSKADGWFYSKVLPELVKIDPEHPENVRIVFGFDS